MKFQDTTMHGANDVSGIKSVSDKRAKLKAT